MNTFSKICDAVILITIKVSQTLEVNQTVDLLFVQFILVQPVFVQFISSNPNLT